MNISSFLDSSLKSQSAWIAVVPLFVISTSAQEEAEMAKLDPSLTVMVSPDPTSFPFKDPVPLFIFPEKSSVGSAVWTWQLAETVQNNGLEIVDGTLGEKS